MLAIATPHLTACQKSFLQAGADQRGSAGICSFHDERDAAGAKAAFWLLCTEKHTSLHDGWEVTTLRSKKHQLITQFSRSKGACTSRRFDRFAKANAEEAGRAKVFVALCFDRICGLSEPSNSCWKEPWSRSLIIGSVASAAEQSLVCNFCEHAPHHQ